MTMSPENVTMDMTTMTQSNVTEGRFIGTLPRTYFNTIIIVVACVIGEILFALLVLMLHKCLAGKREERKKTMKTMRNMEWKGVSTARRKAHEIVPILAEPRYQNFAGRPAAASAIMSPVEAPPEMEMSIYKGVGVAGGPPTEPPGTEQSPEVSPRRDSPQSPRQPPSRPVPSPTHFTSDVSKDDDFDGDDYDVPPDEGGDDAVYDIPPDNDSPDGYVVPNIGSIEDPDIDDYEVPPGEA